jgi:hypothetical protein
MASVTNLFQSLPGEAELSYSYYLSRLAINGRHRRIVDACRRIRRHAAAAGRPRLGDFTYHFEIEALCRLREWSTAWRQLRRLERIDFGRPIDLLAKSWSPRELDRFRYHYPPILYFLGRYRLARRLLEAVLAPSLAPGKNGMSYRLLPFVFKPVSRPRFWQDVTLHHLYRKLGKSLLEWPGWRDFVAGFHPKLVRLAGLTRRQLSDDPALLRRLSKAIAAEERRRLTARVSFGERDLTDPLPQVRRRQERVAIKSHALDRAMGERNRRVEEIFPEIRHLSRLGVQKNRHDRRGRR